MKTIYKYETYVDDKVIITMPAGAKILAVQSQNNIPCIWAEVETEAPTEDRIFEFFGTGQALNSVGNKRKYIGTFQLSGGMLVFHLFEKVKP